MHGDWFDLPTSCLLAAYELDRPHLQEPPSQSVAIAAARSSAFLAQATHPRGRMDAERRWAGQVGARLVKGDRSVLAGARRQKDGGRGVEPKGESEEGPA